MPYYPPSRYFGRALIAACADALCLVAAAALSWHLLAPPVSPTVYGAFTALGVVGSFAALYYVDAYVFRVLRSGRETLQSVLALMGLAFVFAGGIYYFVQTPPGAIEVMAQTAACYFPLLIAERAVFRFLSALTLFTDRLLVVGTSDLGVAISRFTHECRKLGTELVGFLSDELIDERASIGGVPVLGKTHQLEKIVEEYNINHVVVASKNRTEHFPAEALLMRKMRGIAVESGVSFYERVSGRVYVRDLRPSYLIFSDGFRVNRIASAFKRTLDVVVSAAGLLIVSPLLLVCAVAIRVDSKGPVLYGQQRVGKHGKLFPVLKLRSMRVDAEAESGPVWTQAQDDRITQVGRVLRKTRVDEFPQLWNVLRGDMSLVGPRPERPEFVEILSERYPFFPLRSSIRPGVTGWAQIRKGYVNEVEDFEEKLALDIYYMKYRSTVMDLLILWKTAKTVVLMSGV
jgi:sugar transferase (PEP-CTERM system associated)